MKRGWPYCHDNQEPDRPEDTPKSCTNLIQPMIASTPYKCQGITLYRSDDSTLYLYGTSKSFSISDSNPIDKNSLYTALSRPESGSQVILVDPDRSRLASGVGGKRSRSSQSDSFNVHSKPPVYNRYTLLQLWKGQLKSGPTPLDECVIRSTMDIFNWETDRSTHKYALQSWVHAASINADYHQTKAKYLRYLHITLQTIVIVCTTTSMVVSAVMASVQDTTSLEFDLSYFVVLANALSTIAAGYASLQDPAGRRREHLIAENVWDNLGRDIAVYIHNGDVGEESDFTKLLTVQDFQRRIDNATTISPLDCN